MSIGIGTGVNSSYYNGSYYAGTVRGTGVKASDNKAAGTAEASAAAGSSLKKPSWNPGKVYKYLEDMSEGFQSYKREAVTYYSARIAEGTGEEPLTVEELEEQIKEWFPEYTLTDSEPRDVVQGKFYLYIDRRQLEKMASDADYRAKVYGLMDSELQGKKGYTLQYSDGRNVTSHLTGSIFSLAESNRKYAGADGIPYHGSCTSDHAFSTSKSHPQVKSMSYLYDNLDPVKSAAKERKAAAAKAEMKRLEKKRAEKKLAKKTEEKRKTKKLAEEKQLEKKAEEKKAEEKQAEKKEAVSDTMKYMVQGLRYQSAEDIATDASEDAATDVKVKDSGYR